MPRLPNLVCACKQKRCKDNIYGCSFCHVGCGEICAKRREAMLINSGGKKRNRGRPPKAKEPGIDGDINSSQTQNPAKKPRRAVKNQTSIINTRHRNNTRQSVNTNQSRGVMFASRTNMSPAPLLNKSNFKYPPAKTTPMVAARAILDQSITKSELKRMGNRYLKLHDPYTLFALDDEYDQQVASTNEQIASTDITDGR